MNTLCAIRDINRALAAFELAFQTQHAISLKEGMLLCCIGDQCLSATEIAKRIDLTNSNCSKTIKSTEEKGLLCRTLGENDKRQMYFSLTVEGKQFLANIHSNGVPVPELLQPLFLKCDRADTETTED